MRYGLIAQELEQVLPGLVNEMNIETEEGDKYKAVNYIELIPILIGAIQELEEEVQSLKSQINNK